MSNFHLFRVCKESWIKERQSLSNIIDNCGGERGIRWERTRKGVLDWGRNQWIPSSLLFENANYFSLLDLSGKSKI